MDLLNMDQMYPCLAFDRERNFNEDERHFLLASQLGQALFVNDSLCTLVKGQNRVCHIFTRDVSVDYEGIPKEILLRVIKLHGFITEGNDILNGIIVSDEIQRMLSRSRIDASNICRIEKLQIASIIFTQLYLNHLDSSEAGEHELVNFEMLFGFDGRSINCFLNGANDAYEYVKQFHLDTVNILEQQVIQFRRYQLDSIKQQEKQREIKLARRNSPRNTHKGMRKRRK